MDVGSLLEEIWDKSLQTNQNEKIKGGSKKNRKASRNLDFNEQNYGRDVGFLIASFYALSRFYRLALNFKDGFNVAF